MIGGDSAPWPKQFVADRKVYLGQKSTEKYVEIIKESFKDIISKYVIIFDPNVREIASRIGHLLQSTECNILYFEQFASHKTRIAREKLENFLFDHFCHRDTLLLAVGGGSVTDFVGFVASTYYRGIPWLAFPTTLLAMVDASIGGKTGIDIPEYGKNLIGSFYPPSFVFSDLSSLRTLSRVAWRDGWAEIIKLVVLFSKEKFEFLEENVFLIRNIFSLYEPLESTLQSQLDLSLVLPLIEWAIETKLQIVAQDQKEELTFKQEDTFFKKPRILLNFGHTIGHALENGNPSLSHGEAVAYGIILETRLAYFLGMNSKEKIGLTRTCVLRIEQLLINFGFSRLAYYLPSNEKELEIILNILKRDKKSIENRQHVILIEDIGKLAPYSSFSVPFEAFQEVLSNWISIQREMSIRWECLSAKESAFNLIVPGSKSITNRSLLLAVLRPSNLSPITLSNVLISEDTLIMISVLKQLGLGSIRWIGDSCLIVQGCLEASSGDLPSLISTKIFVGNAGTVARILLPLLPFFKAAFPDSKIEVYSATRMVERPFHQLREAFSNWPVFQFHPKTKNVEQFHYDDEHMTHFMTVFIGRIPDEQIHMVIKAQGSSQFISSLCILQAIKRNFTFSVIDSTTGSFIEDWRKIPSFPYIEMTRKMIPQFSLSRYHTIHSYRIDLDWSSASYPLALACLYRTKVVIVSQGNNDAKDFQGSSDLQGDVEFLNILCRYFSCSVQECTGSGSVIFDGSTFTLPLNPLELDFSQFGDTFMTLLALIYVEIVHRDSNLVQEKSTMIQRDSKFSLKLTGLSSQNNKESNRVEVMANQLEFLTNVVIVTFDSEKFNWISLESKNTSEFAYQSFFEREFEKLPRSGSSPSEILWKSFEDHRVFMSGAIVCLGLHRLLRIRLLDPECTKKTWPFFFQDISQFLSKPI